VLSAGFDADFILNDPFSNYYTLLRDYDQPVDNTYFRREAPERDINRFFKVYLRWYEATKDVGYISMPTGNHDTIRPSYRLDTTELKLAYAFLFTMPGVPFLYYGDEIGMRYLDLPTEEGGYFRTGTRTPMQWNGGANLGFSEADAGALYLPVDPAADAPTVENQEGDPDSLLNTVRALLKLRHAEADLQADGPLQVLCAEKGRPLVYRRGSLTLALNPSGEKLYADLEDEVSHALYMLGKADANGRRLVMGPQSFVVMR